jgi:hypothetical protein
MAIDQSGEMPILDRKNYLIFLDKCLMQPRENTEEKLEVLLDSDSYNREAKQLMGIISLS